MKQMDAQGRSFDDSALDEPQTARVLALQNHYITGQLDGLTPAKAARLLKEADSGNIVAQHELFDDLHDRDAHIRAEFEKRTGALLGLNWQIQPPATATPAEKAGAQWVQDILKNAVSDFEDLIEYLMTAVGHGFAPVELEWQLWGGEKIPQFHHRPQTWFTLSQDRRELRLSDNTSNGLALQPFGWILHQHQKPKTGYIQRAGLYRPLIWPFIYKAYSIGDFADFLETYGLPFIVGKHPPGATPKEKSSLARAIAALGRDARATMPDGMAVELMKVTTSGDSLHLSMANWADGAISKAILGQTLSAEGKSTGLGSGVANLHAEVRRDILVADARRIAATLTRDLVYPLLVLNKGGLDNFKRCPRFVFDVQDTEDIQTFSEALPKLTGVGMQIPLAWAHERLGVPLPQEGEAVLNAPASPSGNTAPTAAAKVTLKAESSATQPNVYPVVSANTMDAATQDVMAGVLAHVQKLVNDAQDLPALRDALLAAYGSLPTEKLTQIMALGFAAADLAGRFDVRETQS